MIEWLGAILLVLGAAFVLVAAIGLVRLPDLLMRMHASTKAGTLGVGLTMLGVITVFASASVVARAVVIIVFVLLTAPVSAHMIGRAAYMAGVDLWSGTVVDELFEHRQAGRRRVDSEEDQAE